MRKLTFQIFTVILLVVSFFATNIIMNSGLLASVSPYRQEVNATWERYTSKGEGFSVLMPEMPGIIETATCLDGRRCEKKRLDKTYAAYADGVVYLVTSFQNLKRRQTLKEIISDSLSWYGSQDFDVTAEDKVTVNKKVGTRYSLKSKTRLDESTVTYFLTPDHVYGISVVTEHLNQPAIQKFFESFVLGSTKGKEIGLGARIGLDSGVASAVPKSNTPNSDDNQAVTTFKPKEVTRKAFIILKPRPEYTEDARQNQIFGTVTLQMVFASSGKVTNIRTISGLPHGLTEQAIGAARKIYFLPAVKDGKRVSMYIKVEYNFNIY